MLLKLNMTGILIIFFRIIPLYYPKSKYKNYSSYNDEPIIENILIPQTVNGYPVTGIERDAFKNSSITNITLPDTISFINKYALWAVNTLKI